MSHEVKDFSKEVIEFSKSVPVLVDFWAEWCGPCKILGPVLERLADKHKERWVLKKVDTEAMPDIAAQYGIRSIPNVKLFVNGAVVDEFVGALPEEAIERWLQKALPDTYHDQLDKAQRLIFRQNFTDAAVILESVLASVPEHEHARSLLALSLLFTDRKRAVGLIADLDQGSQYWELVDTVRTLDELMAKLDAPNQLTDQPAKTKYISAIRSLVKADFDEVLRQFIEIIREDRKYDDDGSRKACIAIFKYLGEEHDITLKHRRDFGNALYV
jgi:putative thioredoxin